MHAGRASRAGTVIIRRRRVAPRAMRRVAGECPGVEQGVGDCSTAPLPSWRRIAPGSGVQLHELSGLGTPVGHGLCVRSSSWWFHPLQDFEHPLEATHLITRLWPEPPTELDLATPPGSRSGRL